MVKARLPRMAKELKPSGVGTFQSVFRPLQLVFLMISLVVPSVVGP